MPPKTYIRTAAATIACLIVGAPIGGGAQTAPSSRPNVAANTNVIGAPGPTGAVSAKEDKVICRREADTGSLLVVHKTCHTQAEWDAISRDARDQLNNVQQSATRVRSGD